VFIQIGYFKLIKIVKVQRLIIVKLSWTELLSFSEAPEGFLNIPERRGKLLRRSLVG